VLGDVIDQEDYVGSYYNRDSLSTIHVRCEPAPPPQQAAAGDGDGEEELGAGSDESSSNIDMPKLLIRSESGPADFIADWQEDDDDEWLGDEDTEVSNSAPPLSPVSDFLICKTPIVYQDRLGTNRTKGNPQIQKGVRFTHTRRRIR
jgi:hypothetical protein